MSKTRFSLAQVPVHRHKIVHLSTIFSLLIGILATLFAGQANAFTNGQAASIVLGQATFTAGAAATANNRMDTATGVAVDPTSGAVYVADRSNNRVLRFASGAALVTGAAATGVFGQSNFTTNTAATANNRLNQPRAVHVDSAGNLWVADSGNNRVLRFDNAGSETTTAVADLVFGQGNNFNTSNTIPLSATSLNDPRGLAIDSAGNLWVGDSGNNRVLRYNNVTGTIDATADVVLGQANFTSNAAPNPPSAQSMNDPRGLAVDSAGNLWVADRFNHRVLRFANATTATTNAAATAVLGQAAFNTRNTGATTGTSMSQPYSVVVDSNGRLFVADSSNNRVLRFNAAASKPNGGTADGVLGQANLTSNAAATTQTGVDTPTGVAVDGNNNLWVADSANSRVLRYDRPVPTITWANPAAITYGTALSATQLNATASVPGTFSYTPAAGTILNAGNGQTLQVNFTPTDSATYRSASQSVTINVNPANQTITFNAPASRTYGDADINLVATASSNLPVSFQLISGPATLTGNVISITGAGTIVVRASQAGNSNYNAAPTVDQSITINPAPLTITADDKTKYVNTANPPLTASYNGFVNGDDETDLDTPVTLATTAVTGSAVGDYPITASGASDANYTITLVDGTLTVTPKQVPVITWANPAAITYGTALSATQLNATASVPGTFSYTPAAGTVLDAGNSQTLAVEFTPTDTDTYAVVTSQVAIDVNPAALTITGTDATKVYGESMPTLSATVTGLVNGDTAATLATPLSVTSDASSASDVGDYLVIVEADDPNYTITLTNGAFTVTPAPLTITADDKVKTVNTPNPPLTASYSGFVNGDTESSLDTPVTLTTTAVTNSPVTTYPITASGASDTNYTITFVDGTLTVTAQQVPVITWTNPAAITYGTALSVTQLNAIASVPGTFSYTPTTGTVLDAGNSQTLSVTFTPTDSVTYTSVEQSVSIDVARATLSITGTDATKVYGASMPTLSATVTGLVNGDTAATLATPLSVTSDATATSNVGNYLVIVEADDPNYTITLTNGAFTVTPAPLTITADDKVKTVNTPNPPLTASYSGFVNGDTESSLDTPVTLATTAVTSSAVGDYPIAASGASDANYTITLVDGTLTVTPKQVPVITWTNPAAITYGTALSATQLNATASVPGIFSYSPVAGTRLNAGNSQTLSVTFTPADTATYATVEKSVSINVARAALTISADNKTRAFGASNPALTATYTGLVAGDTPASFSSPLILATSAGPTSPIGTYLITVSGASSPNYTITFVNGTLTVTNPPRLFLPLIHR